MFKSIVAAIVALLASTFGLFHSSSTPAQPTAVAQPASYEITVVNDYFASSTTLVAGTRFETADGEVLHSLQPVTVPGKSGAADGTVTISVIGVGGVNPTGRLTLPGLAASRSLFAHIYAIATTPAAAASQAAAAAAPIASNPITQNQESQKSTTQQTTSLSSGQTFQENEAQNTTPQLSDLSSAVQSNPTVPNNAGTVNEQQLLPFATTGDLTALQSWVRGYIALATSTTETAYVPQQIAGGGNSENPFAAAQAIDNLSGITITNPTITGLSASEIPDLSGSYLSLNGGALTGALIDSGTGASSFAGSLGIGTTTPSDTFALNGAAYFANIAAPPVTTNRLYNNSGTLYWAGNPIAGATTGAWTSDGTNVWRAAGKVGIGTTSPTATLTLDSSSPNGTIMRVSNSSTGGHIYDWLSTGSGNTGGAGRLDLFDYTAGAARLSIVSNGYVGIGTISPSATLDVNGNVNIATNGNGYQIGDQTVLTASSTSGSTLAGFGAGASLTATSSNFSCCGFGDQIGDTAFGYQAFNIATSTLFATAVGYQAMQNSTNGADLYGTAVGYQALQDANNPGAQGLTAVGYQALQDLTSGTHNTAVGGHAMWRDTTGGGSVAFGDNALESDQTANNNTAIGYFAMIGNDAINGGGSCGSGTCLTGNSNVALGSTALETIENGAAANTAIGTNSMGNATSPSNTVAVGAFSMQGSSTPPSPDNTM